MQIILLEKIKHLGELGDVIRVKDGYARNFLLPQGKAAPATAENLAKFEERRAALEATQEERLNAAKKRAEAVEGFTVTVYQKSGVEGRLFGSVTNHDIAVALTQAGHTVNKTEVSLPNGPIKSIGEYQIELILHSQVHAICTVQVMAA